MEQKMDLAIGGQALIEGVMIRAPKMISIAVRKPNGEIVVKKDPYVSYTKRSTFLRLPLIRGVVNLVEMMIIGMRALDYSAQQAVMEDSLNKASASNEKGSSVSLNQAAHANHQGSGEKTTTNLQKFGRILMVVVNIFFSLALGIFLFKFIPLFLTEQLRKAVPLIARSTFLFNLIDGLIRIALFFAYIGILSQIKIFRRVFEYHGAEHKAVFVYEKELPLTVENVRKESPRHPRCGTSFIMIVLILSILIFSLIPRNPVFIFNFMQRLAVIPLIAGLAYEVLKYTAKFRHKKIVSLLTYPGILTQYITTKEADDKQIEVAIAAVKGAVE